MNAPTTEAGERPAAAHRPSARLARMLDRVPADIRGGFTPEQLAALEAALDDARPSPHAVNLRVTLFGRAYLVVLAGRERRKAERRAWERTRHPLRTPGNIVFLIAVAAAGLAVGDALRRLLLGG